MNPLLAKRNEVRNQKPQIHLLVKDPNGQVISKGNPTLSHARGAEAQGGVHRWNPACGKKLTLAPGSGDICTGDAMAVSCQACLNSQLFLEEARIQYPAVMEAVDEAAQDVLDEVYEEDENE